MDGKVSIAIIACPVLKQTSCLDVDLLKEKWFHELKRGSE